MAYAGKLLRFVDIGRSSWDEQWHAFADVYETLRRRLAELLGLGGVRLWRKLHPPAFTTYLSSWAFTHGASQDAHTDALLHSSLRRYVERQLAAEHSVSVEKVSCEWEAQLSLLVALAMPPGGGALQYFTYEGDAAGGRALVVREVAHAVGRAIVFEATRPHKLGPSAEVDGVETPRMVLHAFLVPCACGAVTEYQLLGPMGG